MSSSSKPSKQRKEWYNLPKHLSKTRLRGHLSKDLRNQLGKRSVTIAKGDRVVVTKGDFKGIEENVARVDRRKGQVFVNNVSRENAKGEKILVPMCPSSIIIIKLNEEDKRRLSKSKASVSGNKVETENKGED